MTKEFLETMARYNRAMNAQMMDACDGLPDDMRREDRGAWFKSIHGTWNHLLVTDKIWLGRFTGQLFQAPSLDWEMCSSWDELRAQRAACDEEIIAYVEFLLPEQLKQKLEFQPMSRPGRVQLSLWVALAHFFNHQTHHRGQITTLMNQMGLDSGATDLPMLPGVVSAST
jgi:uncharacterized damage-inducible protein DinB